MYCNRIFLGCFQTAYIIGKKVQKLILEIMAVVMLEQLMLLGNGLEVGIITY